MFLFPPFFHIRSPKFEIVSILRPNTQTFLYTRPIIRCEIFIKSTFYNDFSPTFYESVSCYDQRRQCYLALFCVEKEMIFMCRCLSLLRTVTKSSRWRWLSQKMMFFLEIKGVLCVFVCLFCEKQLKNMSFSLILSNFYFGKSKLLELSQSF